MNLKYVNILKNNNNNNNNNCIYKEKTNVFSYYILKSIILINLEEFLNMCKLHNYLNIENEKQFLYFILKIYKSNNVLNKYYNIENNPIYNNNNKNLKMTICE